MAEGTSGQGALTVRRRGFLVSAALASVGALIAVDVAGSAPSRGIDALSSDEVKLRHLLRRAGFGAGPDELRHYRSLGLSGTVDRLLNFEQVDNRALEVRLAGLGLDLTKRADLQRWWALRMIYTARPLEEKMTLFWHGLLTSALSKVGRAEPMLVQNQFLRANALGRFPDILKGISRDPAMMIWLDTATNKKGHPNENYARELMELFALGVGNYTENDVREAARAFTGWSLRGRPKEGHLTFFFDRRQHDDGVKTFLGQTGPFDGDDIVDIVVRQPASARHLARRLFSFFAYPDPSDDVLQPLITAYTESDYSIKAMLRALLTSDAFYSPRAYRAQVKSPVDFAVGAARLLGVETDGRGLPLALARMGQELFNPPNVAGWPGGRSWLASGTWLTRLNFANQLVASASPAPKGKRAEAGALSFDLAALFGGATTVGDLVDRLADLLLDGQINAEQRQVLADYLTPPGGDLTSAEPAWLDERRRGAIYLALAMPEFHLS